MLDELLAALSSAGKAGTLDPLAAAVALRRLPALLGTAAAAAPAEGLARHIEGSGGIEAPALPATWPEGAQARARFWHPEQPSV